MSALTSYPIEKPLEGLESYYDEFLANREKEHQELLSALTQKNFTVIAEMAHKWKGFSEPYGFGQLGKIAKELEEMAKSGQDQKCQELLASVGAYLTHKKTVHP